ncbi:glycosyltransferase family 2 protein [Luteimonas sp. SMYT11W]|uniref:Glycosyltransferase family 2 protein n=1 Tax=Luteimonas flava TaxID=3115822 RepID=A0ABU7WG92_9GAMM
MNTVSSTSAIGLPGWTIEPVFDLEPSDRPGYWRATGSDPQFVLIPKAPLRAGWYQVSFLLDADRVQTRRPVFYVDAGEGFTEQGRTSLDCGASSAVAVLMKIEHDVLRLRFDPIDVSGEFLLRDLQIRGLTPAEAAWLALREERDQWGSAAPLRFAAFLAQARRQQDTQGAQAVPDWILAQRLDANAPTRYLRWIRNAESQVPAPAEGGAGVSVIVLPRADIADALAAYASVIGQLGRGDEVLIPRELAAELPQIPDGVLVVDRSDPVLYGLSEASKPFVTWIGPGERLHRDALVIIRDVLDRRPGTKLAYTDEDFIDDTGERHTPCFKPDWDATLLLSQDYPARSVVLDRQWVQSCAATGPVGDAWLYSISLIASETLDRDAIVHIPAVTRHHVHAPGPLFAPLHADALAQEAAMHLALTNWAGKWHAAAEIQAAPLAGLARVLWPVPDGARIDIVIPTRDRVELLKVCVDSLLALTRTPDYTVTILDNGSVEAETLAYFDRICGDPRVRVIRHDVPFNYSAINNHAVAQGDGDFVVLLNNDTEIIDAHWLDELVGLAARPGVGAVGARLLFPDGRLQHGGVILGVGAVEGGVAAHAHMHLSTSDPGYFGRAQFPQAMSAVTAACLCVSRVAFEAVNGLDESLSVAFNDVDFCLRLREAGYINLWTPYATLIHHESASRGYEDTPEKQARFQSEVRTMLSRWHAQLGSDPAYNPNLALTPREFTIDPRRYARRGAA